MAKIGNRFKSAEKFELKAPLEIEALAELMLQSGFEWPGQFGFGKTFAGRRIQFESFMGSMPCVSVKGNTVTCI